jgi:hypothetical protein
MGYPSYAAKSERVDGAERIPLDIELEMPRYACSAVDQGASLKRQE